MPVYARGAAALSTMVRDANSDLAQAIVGTVLGLAQRGFECVFTANDAGKTNAKFIKDGENPYSFIVNSDNLLFYLRSPTIGIVPDTLDLDIEHGQPRERQVRIFNLAEAEKLISELDPYLK